MKHVTNRSGNGFGGPPGTRGTASALLGRKKSVTKRKRIFEQSGDAINGRHDSVVVGLANANVNPSESGGPSTSEVARKTVVRRDEVAHFHELLYDIGVRLYEAECGGVVSYRRRFPLPLSLFHCHPFFTQFAIDLNEARWSSEMARWKTLARGFPMDHLRDG